MYIVINEILTLSNPTINNVKSIIYSILPQYSNPNDQYMILQTINTNNKIRNLIKKTRLFPHFKIANWARNNPYKFRSLGALVIAGSILY
jgi:hypothetical protein